MEKGTSNEKDDNLSDSHTDDDSSDEETDLLTEEQRLWKRSIMIQNAREQMSKTEIYSGKKDLDFLVRWTPEQEKKIWNLKR